MTIPEQVDEPSLPADGSPAGDAADMAHELNNVLTVVLGSLEQLQRQPLDDRGRRQLERAQTGVRRASLLVQQVLGAQAWGAQGCGAHDCGAQGCQVDESTPHGNTGDGPVTPR